MAMKKKSLPALAPKIFEHEQFGQFRFILISEELWFIAADVCKILELDNVSQALSRLDEDERGSITLSEGTSPKGGSPVRAVVNEFGLYRLIMGSRTPAAKKFRRWVYHEVLPAIRKFGYYLAPHQKIIEIEGRDNLEKFKAQYPEGSVEIKRMLLGFDEKDNGEYDDITIFEVVLHLNGTDC